MLGDAGWWFTSVFVPVALAIFVPFVLDRYAKYKAKYEVRRAVRNVVGKAYEDVALSRLLNHPELAVVELIDDRGDRGWLLFFVLAASNSVFLVALELPHVGMPFALILFPAPAVALYGCFIMLRNVFNRSLLLQRYRQTVLHFNDT